MNSFWRRFGLEMRGEDLNRPINHGLPIPESLGLMGPAPDGISGVLMRLNVSGLRLRQKTVTRKPLLVKFPKMPPNPPFEIVGISVSNSADQ